MQNIYWKTILIFLIASVISFSQDFSNIRICINPGHGGHDSNDRYIAATGFWESDGNLDKGLYLKHILEGFNADIVMTRETNTTADDLPLSQIVSIANSNNVDYFHSIHSNAYNAQSNYTLLLFQGGDNTPTYPGAKTMGNYIADEIYRAHRTTAEYVRGDFDFYGTGRPYLGVFKGLNMPGTLSEGSFHDYVPESWRLRDMVYKKHEAWAIAKAFITYFNLMPITTGMIAGIVRDPEQTVDYYSIPGTKDNLKPINNIKITLEPGNIVYNGDYYNNGFFMFDSLAPGQYKIIYECENYIKDSSTVTVTANNTVFADKYLQFDTTIAPIILSHFPIESPDSVQVSTVIKISFNRSMNKESVENAFSIIPNISGAFSWEDFDQTLVFTPDSTLDGAANYSVNISTLAQSKWNVPIDSEYTFSFLTYSRDRLSLLKTYPNNNQENISNTVQIRLIFDAPIFNGSLAGQVKLTNSSDQNINVKNVRIFSQDGKGYIYFEPQSSLQPNSNYKLTLEGGISDLDQIQMVDPVEINFKTINDQNNFGIILNKFDSVDEWNLNTAGTDNTVTKLSLSSVQSISTNYSCKLDYLFSSKSDGLVKISSGKEINFGPEKDINFGFWVFGDLSFNKLECSFGTDSLLTQNYFIDTLNWTGWKLLKIQVPDINNNYNKLFYSISVIQDSLGVSNSTIYIDDPQYSTSTTSIGKNLNKIVDYKLYQNYPNPFNPSTTIKYQVPKQSFVTLKVYDILGREVCVLIHEEKSAGVYSIEFSNSHIGKNLTSGIYFYTLKAGNFMSTKKLVLLK
jgi:N-acetylmuramoyl-L-alanine amidase